MEQKKSNDLRRTLPEEIGYTLASPYDLPFIHGFCYLAAPYNHEDPNVIEQRMVAYETTDAALAALGFLTMSPLAKHHILKYRNLPGDFNYWKTYCLQMLALCKAMIVVKIPGWEKSKGVIAEIDYCRENGIPIYFLDPVN